MTEITLHLIWDLNGYQVQVITPLKEGFSFFFTVAAYVNPFVVNDIISLMFKNEILVLFGTDNHR